MKKSRILSYLVFLILLFAIGVAVLINIENKLKKRVQTIIEHNPNLEAKDVNIRFFRWFPKLGVELEGAVVYLRKDKRIHLNSPSIVAKFKLLELIQNRDEILNQLQSIESPTNKLSIEKGAQLHFESDYSFELKRQSPDQFVLDSKLRNVNLNHQAIDFPEMQFTAPIAFNLSQKEFSIKDAQLSINDILIQLQSQLVQKQFSASANSLTDSSQTSLILPHLFFNQVAHSQGRVTTQAQVKKDSAEFTYTTQSGNFTIGKDTAQLDLKLLLNKGVENELKLNFELANFSNKHLEQIRYFPSVQNLAQFYTGAFNLQTQANLQLNNSFRMKRESLYATGNLTAPSCLIENSKMLKEMQKIFGEKYAQLSLADIDASYSIQQGNIHLYPCEFYVDKVKWTANAKISAKNELSGVVTVRIPFQDIKFSEDVSALVNLALASGLIKKASIVSIDVKLAGTLGKPKFQIDVSRLLNKYIGLQKKSSDNLGKTINGFLKNLFR